MHGFRHRLLTAADDSAAWLNGMAVAATLSALGLAVGAGALVVDGPQDQGWAVATVVLLVAALLVAVPSVLCLRRVVHAHELAMTGAHDGIFEWHPVSKRLNVGPRLLSILGYSEDFLSDTHAWLELVHPDDRANYNRAVAAHLKGLTEHFYCEYRVRASSGEYRWIAARGVAVRNGKGIATLMAGSVTDITDRIRREEHIRELALSDQLTGLPNRRCLMDRLPAALAEAERAGAMVAVLFIDLDRFKKVNDTCGHLVGDELLVAIAQRLSRTLRPYDVLVRQGGDELIVMLPGLADAEEADAIARRLLAVVADPASFDDTELRVTASIGVALFPGDARDADTLLRFADMAMYAAKAEGGDDVRFFERGMMERATARASMENRLRIAIENGELELRYQPQKRLADGALVGAEALVRWRDGEHMVSPEVFVALAEETGLIDPLGQWVIEAAVRQLAQWHERGADALRVSINLSPRQFLKRAVDLDLIAAASRAGLPARRFELEITESVLLAPGSRALAALNALRDAGCRIALDDFGTGYSSLSYLQLLDFDCLKIDKSFIHNLDLSLTARGARNGAAIVSAMIALAHRLGYEVVAEGIESADQQLWLKTLGCDLGQGYFYSPPLPPGEFAAQFLAEPQALGSVAAAAASSPARYAGAARPASA
ncbi:MAG TPA: EAL domain-containing protein [Rhodocyclaceae bacterium]|nr:EAL domain-containing protein [Rhodocyclaceae bacterium]